MTTTSQMRCGGISVSNNIMCTIYKPFNCCVTNWIVALKYSWLQRYEFSRFDLGMTQTRRFCFPLRRRISGKSTFKIWVSLFIALFRVCCEYVVTSFLKVQIRFQWCQTRASYHHLDNHCDKSDYILLEGFLETTFSFTTKLALDWITNCSILFKILLWWFYLN